jgi:hypothetical protein
MTFSYDVGSLRVACVYMACAVLVSLNYINFTAMQLRDVSIKRVGLVQHCTCVHDQYDCIAEQLLNATAGC